MGSTQRCVARVISVPLPSYPSFPSLAPALHRHVAPMLPCAVVFCFVTLSSMWPHPGAACATPPPSQLPALPTSRRLEGEGSRPSIEEEAALEQVGCLPLWLQDALAPRCICFSSSFSHVALAVCAAGVDAHSVRPAVPAGHPCAVLPFFRIFIASFHTNQLFQHCKCSRLTAFSILQKNSSNTHTRRLETKEADGSWSTEAINP